MTPEQCAKLISELEQFFNDFQKQIQIELGIFESGARGKVRFVSEWLTKMHEINVQHILKDTPWQALKTTYGETGEAIETVLDEDKWQPGQWLEKLREYTLRAQEALQLKGDQLALNALFIPVPFHERISKKYSEFCHKIDSILRQFPESSKGKPDKSWYTEKDWDADSLVRLQVNAYGLMSETVEFNSRAKKDLATLASRRYNKPNCTNKSVCLAAQEADTYLPRSFTPMQTLFAKKPLDPGAINTLVSTLNLPNPRP